VAEDEAQPDVAASPVGLAGHAADLQCRSIGCGTVSAETSTMSVQREELLKLVEELPEDEVPVVLDDLRRHLGAGRELGWPPAWFGAGRGAPLMWLRVQKSC
jgi:hypothetical protein